MDWEEAMEEAREELGYYADQYVEDWDGLVDTAREIYEYYKQEEYDEFCEDAHFQHKEYLSSDRWKKLRYEILKRDNFTCQDCGNRARDVHHLDYGYLGTSEEAKFCISLCRECHKKRHNISSPSNQTQGATPSFNKGLTAMQQVASPKCPSDTSLNPNIMFNNFLPPQKMETTEK